MLKQAACFEACFQLYLVDALTDHLVPDMVLKETVQQNLGNFLLLHFCKIYSVG